MDFSNVDCFATDLFRTAAWRKVGLIAVHGPYSSFLKAFKHCPGLFATDFWTALLQSISLVYKSVLVTLVIFMVIARQTSEEMLRGELDLNNF